MEMSFEIMGCTVVTQVITNVLAAGCSDAEAKLITGHRSDCFKSYGQQSTELARHREDIRRSGKSAVINDPACESPGLLNTNLVSKLDLSIAESSPSRIPLTLPPPPTDINANPPHRFDHEAAEFFGLAMRAFVDARRSGAPPS